MDETKKLLERLMLLYAPWEVVSVSCQEGGEDHSPGRVTIWVGGRCCVRRYRGQTVRRTASIKFGCLGRSRTALTL